MQSELCSPATDSDIFGFEKEMQIVIPESYKAFLRISNGANLFGGDCILYSVNLDDELKINYDFSEGNVPKELMILGLYHTRHICYDIRYNSFFFYEYEEYDNIKEECIKFSDFYEVLDYIIDIAIN
ncbi:SMI1/KNR4 family protein [Ruminococcus sp.]|uniref:SMI1/KNR4 family protein n=1 Tax=Ruminococcus sp. TaxID=41978 RepID=UPI0025F003CC|nr:SMI1/KNR4 family protein [Ruminococcus sp.]